MPPGGSAPKSVNYEAAQWANRAGQINQIHAAGYTGKGVRVAVIDSVVDVGHGDLKDRVRENYVIMDGIPVENPSEMRSSSGHGTHVASIIAGSRDGYGVTGVAPEADLITVGVPGVEGGAGTLSQVITDITAAISLVAGDVDIINLSLGGSVFEDQKVEMKQLQRMCSAVKLATAAGTLVVAAAGNDGWFVNLPSMPASCKDALSVSAVSADLTATDWTSFDGSVSVGAPGDRITAALDRDLLSTYLNLNTNETHPVIEMSGTSMSAPYTAGVAALIMQKHPTYTPQQVTQLLTSTATDTGTAGVDPKYGYGLINPSGALGLPGKLQAQPHASWNLVRSFDDTTTYLAWNVPTVGSAVTSYTVTFTSSSTHTVLYQKQVPGDTVRLSVPNPLANGKWEITGINSEGVSFSTGPYLVLANSVFSSEPLVTTEVKKGADGLPAIAWKTSRPLKSNETVTYAIAWEYPVVSYAPISGTMPTNATEGDASGQFAADPAKYLKKVDYDYRTGTEKRTYGTFREPIASALRQYALTGAPYIDVCVVDKTTLSPIYMNYFEPPCSSSFLEPTEPVRAWYSHNNDGTNQLYVAVASNIDPKLLNLRISEPGKKRQSLSFNNNGVATLKIGAKTGPVAKFDIVGSGAPGISPRNPSPIYAIRI